MLSNQIKHQDLHCLQNLTLHGNGNGNSAQTQQLLCLGKKADPDPEVLDKMHLTPCTKIYTWALLMKNWTILQVSTRRELSLYGLNI